jgi:hypothetical protein
MLGVRRENTDADGSKFLRRPGTNEEIFKEPVQSDGVVKDFSKAAGLEHQANKHADNVVFDKKAVFQSVKNFI